jgi:hypothetical protein
LIATKFTSEDSIYKNMLSYILTSAEETKEEFYVPGIPALLNPLLSLNLPTYGEDVPLIYLTKANPTKQFEKEYEDTVALVGRIRAAAYYRLCLSLLKCGAGSIMSASDVMCMALDDTMVSHKDKLHLLKLEDVITVQLEKLFQSKSEDEKEAIRTILQSRCTRIPRERYPWDTYTNLVNIAHDIKTEINCQATGVNIHCTRDRETANRLILTVTRDTFEGKVLINQPSSFYVASGRVVEGNDMGFCDACAVQIAFDTINQEELSSESSINDTEKDSTFLNDGYKIPLTPKKDTEGNRSTTPPSPTFSLLALQTPPSSTSSSSSMKNRDWSYCYMCMQSRVCSFGCRHLLYEIGHSIICDHYQHIDPIQNIVIPGCPGIPPDEERRLQSQMLLRLLTATQRKCRNPLGLRWVGSLDGKLAAPRELRDDLVAYRRFDHNPPSIYTLFPSLKSFKADTSKNFSKDTFQSPTIQWSFQTHVVLPIVSLHAIGKLDYALDTTRLDGWVVNTLMAQIDNCMRVTTAPRGYKVFHESSFTLGVLPDDLAKNDLEHIRSNIWIGSLHPMSWLLGSRNNEEPNATIVECGRALYVVAGNDPETAKHAVTRAITGENGDPPIIRTQKTAIHKGEALRANPVVQYLAPPQEQGHYTFMDPAPKMNVTETSMNIMQDEFQNDSSPTGTGDWTMVDVSSDDLGLSSDTNEDMLFA